MTEKHKKLKFFVLCQVSAENLTGLKPTISSRVVYDGGVFIGPIFGDMLATFNNKTQVRCAVMLPVDSPGLCRTRSLTGIKVSTSATKSFQKSTAFCFAINQSNSAPWFVEEDFPSRAITGGERGHHG